MNRLAWGAAALLCLTSAAPPASPQNRYSVLTTPTLIPRNPSNLSGCEVQSSATNTSTIKCQFGGSNPDGGCAYYPDGGSYVWVGREIAVGSSFPTSYPGTYQLCCIVTDGGSAQNVDGNGNGGVVVSEGP